ncbi:uncharacterized protein [Euphorbia lathyris]|uniref:uncharacterized protein n=1 Tax=Euphorbia lathyris TaxID=212925 RepID=UPI0033142EB8
MDGASKINLGLETLSALGVAIDDANMVFDMCVNDEKLFREMEQGLRNAVAELEMEKAKSASANELLERRDVQIASLSSQLADEKKKNVELLQGLSRDAEELRRRRLLLRLDVPWTRRLQSNLSDKTLQLAKVVEERGHAQVENERLRRELEVAQKEAADLRAFAKQREEKLVKMDRMMLIAAVHGARYEVPPEVIFSPDVFDKEA